MAGLLILVGGVGAGLLLAAGRLLLWRWRAALVARRGTGATGKISAAWNVPDLRGLWLALAGFALQWWLTAGTGHTLAPQWRTPLIWGSHATLAAVALLNLRQFRWMSLLLAGVLLNLAVMTANGGLMPVSPQTLARAQYQWMLDRYHTGDAVPISKDHILEEEATRFALLSDRLVLPGIRGAFSLGDLLAAAGALLVLASAGRPTRPVSAREAVRVPRPMPST